MNIGNLPKLCHRIIWPGRWCGSRLAMSGFAGPLPIITKNTASVAMTKRPGYMRPLPLLPNWDVRLALEGLLAPGWNLETTSVCSALSPRPLTYAVELPNSDNFETLAPKWGLKKITSVHTKLAKSMVFQQLSMDLDFQLARSWSQTSIVTLEACIFVTIKKALQSRSNVKSMLFFYEALVHHEYASKGQKINEEN